MSTILDILAAKYTVFVGSTPENDVVFNDVETSPRHCQISKVGDNNFLIVDLNSATGAFVNNKKIEKEFIAESDFITVGTNIFQLTKKVAPVVNSLNPQVQPVSEHKPAFAAGTPDAPFTENAEKPNSTTKNKISVYFLSAPEDE